MIRKRHWRSGDEAVAACGRKWDTMVLARSKAEITCCLCLVVLGHASLLPAECCDLCHKVLDGDLMFGEPRIVVHTRCVWQVVKRAVELGEVGMRRAG